MGRFLLRFPALGGLQLVALLCTAMAGAESVHAATLTVTSTADGGAGSLRDTIAAASNGDTIQFDAALNGQTITLTSAELAIDKNITISGPGPSVLTVENASTQTHFRIFHVMPGHTVMIEGLKISGGFSDSPGGGVFNDQATLTINNCAVSNNLSSTSGGGIYNDGGSATLAIVNSTVSGNVASQMPSGGGTGGGIYNNGTLEIRNSTVSGNSVTAQPPSPGRAGGIYNAGTLQINDSTISGNTGGAGGGGIGNRGSITITNSTVSFNTVLGFGGGIENLGTLEICNSTVSGNAASFKQSGVGGGIFNGGPLTITNSTFSGNSADGSGGGINNSSGPLQIGNTILNAGAAGANLVNSGMVTSHGYNLSSDDGGGFLNSKGDQLNTNPMLDPLQGNGGQTLTHGLLTGSPALDAGDPNFTPPPLYDQRGPGYDRVFNGRIDIGSLEVQPVTPSPTPTLTPIPTPTPTSTPTATPSPTPTATPTATATATATPCVSVYLRENFDQVTAPALPAGWVTSFTPGPANCTPAGTCALGTTWATNATTPFSPPNCAFHDDPGCVTDSNLDTPSFSYGGGSGSFLIFWHTYDLESGSDGGVLEISINGGAFTDIVTTGGSFRQGGYNGTISTGTLSPIAGRAAWTGNSAGYIQTSVNMPPASVGQNVVLRFRLATDCDGAGTGWRVDEIDLPYVVPCQSPTPSPTATPTPSPMPAAQAINISTRLRVQTGDNVGIAGFIITGTDSKPVLFRGIGPSLTALGINDALANPTLDLRDSNGVRILANNDWRDTQEAEIKATGIPPTNNLEAAIVETLDPGATPSSSAAWA